MAECPIIGPEGAPPLETVVPLVAQPDDPARVLSQGTETRGGGLRRYLGLALAAATAQARLTRHNVEDLMPVLTIPLLSVVSLAILVESGHAELADHAMST